LTQPACVASAFAFALAFVFTFAFAWLRSLASFTPAFAAA
jgi:hypothetical protein